MHKRLTLMLFVLALLSCGFALGRISRAETETVVNAEEKNRVFEIRTYTTEAGRLDALHNRFRQHTTKLFERHGMTNIGYWVPQEGPQAQNTLIYVLAYPNREAAKKSWEGFRNDPEWVQAKTKSEESGKIVSKVESVFVSATDYSPMK